MRKILFATIYASLIALFSAGLATAHTGLEAQGRTTLEKLQSNELRCQDLTDEDFNALGEYFMGQMTGDQHETMGTMMTQMMGQEGSGQMHITMGKRMSGCEPNATLASNGANGGMTSMMSGGIISGNSFAGVVGMVAMILLMITFWGLVIIGIVALVRWVTKRRAHEGPIHNTNKVSSHKGKNS